MSDHPWYKRYGADFVHGCLGLTLEQKGAYSLCLDLIYDRRGPIPDDPRWLAGVCGVSVRKWKTLRAALIADGKIVERESGLSNVRAEKEIENALKTARKHAENGAKGGNKSRENKPGVNENNDIGQAGLKHRARDQKLEARNTTLMTREEVDRVVGSAMAAGGGAMADPAKCPAVLLPSEIFAWLKAGADLEADVLPAIRARASRASPQSIKSWAYFRDPVMEAKARREAGIETPEISNERTSDKSDNTSRHRSAFADALREFGGGSEPGGDESGPGGECAPMRIVDGGRA